MFLAYADDTSDLQCDLAMVGAVLIQHEHFPNVESVAGIVVEGLIPEAKWGEFEEFHAADLYGGHGAFKDIEEVQRFKAIDTLLKVVRSYEISFIYSAVDTRALSRSAFGGANPIDVAFRMCAVGVEQHMALAGDTAFCLLIMDETKDGQLKNQLRRSFNSLRGSIRPPEWTARRLWHIHDDMYFGDSKNSVGIQIADLCNYFVARRLKVRDDPQGFYNIISERVVCSKAEPEWTQFRGAFLEHGVQIAG